ncbi:MAG: hypothetical protein WA005_19155 [Candidatus Binataceae bacterium]
MRPGDTFRITEAGVPSNLWLVLAVDLTGTLLIAPLFPANHVSFDDACVFRANEHSEVSRDSFVNYELVRRVTAETFETLRKFIADRTAFPSELLERARLGCMNSFQASDDHQDFLVQNWN